MNVGQYPSVQSFARTFPSPSLPVYRELLGESADQAVRSAVDSPSQALSGLKNPSHDETAIAGFNPTRLDERRIILLKSNPDTHQYEKHEGILRPDAATGWWNRYCLETEHGIEPAADILDALNYWIEDSSQQSLPEFKRSCTQQGMLPLGEYLNASGQKWQDRSLIGKQASLLIKNTDRQIWERLDGTIQPQGGYWGDAAYAIRSADGTDHPMNLNDSHPFYVER